MNFESPLLVLALIPLGLLWLLQLFRSRSREEKRRFPLFLAAVGLLILALANPYWSTIPAQRILKGVDLVLALDVSQSMFCASGNEGIRRIDQARHFLRTLLPEFSGSQVAIVYFAGDAQIGCPFTSDLRAAYLFLDSIAPAMTATPGTRTVPIEKALSDLIGPADQNLPMSRKPLVLLFSDGEFFDNTKGLRNWLQDHGNVRLFSFLCGTGRGAVPKYDLSGPYRQVVSQTQPEPMQALAISGGGLSFNLSQTNPSTVVRQVTKKVNNIIAEGESIPRYQPAPFFITAILLLIAYQIYPLFSVPLSHRNILLPIVLFLIASVSLRSGSKEFSEALNDIKQKHFESALKKLKELDPKKASKQIQIAIGNVYLYQDKFAEAILQYKQVLRKDPENVVARWNWEVAIKKQRASQAPPKQEPPKSAPEDLPDQTQALLKYFDQLEKEQMQQQNNQNANTSSFAW